SLFIVFNHMWRKLRLFHIPSFISWLLTLFVVVIAWVPFRATSWHSAKSMLYSMMGLNEISLPGSFSQLIPQSLVQILHINFTGMFHNGLALWHQGVILILVALLTAVIMPNSINLFKSSLDTFDRRRHLNDITNRGSYLLSWQPIRRWAFVYAMMFLVLVMMMSQESEFLYFQF